MIDIKLKKLIDQSEVVSFDIFDTLIIRNCDLPSDIFKFVEEKLNIKEGEFSTKRINAEKLARMEKKKGEVTLEEIYQKIDLNNKKLIQKTEIATEYEYCNTNWYIKLVFDYCVSKRKTVFITSDMYLPKEVIIKLLRKAGYSNYDKLLVSSEYNKKKSDGALFKTLIKIANVKKNKIVHIGDNLKSDYFIPKILGLKAYYCNKNKAINYTYEELNVFLKQTKIQNNNFYYTFGYKILGPAILGYVVWLKRQLIKRKITNIYFMAREGKFIKRAFDEISGGNFEEHYIYVSRRSLTVPALAQLSNIRDFFAYRPMYPRVFVGKQIEKLGLTKSDFVCYKWYSEKIINKEIGSLPKSLRAEIANDMFKEAKKQGKKELPFLIQYLKQENMKGKFAIVDLGWNGSMQRALAQVLHDSDIQEDMTGFFLAQRDEYYKNAKYISNYGYLFDYGKVSKQENLLLNSGTALLEFLFSADHGSTKNYISVNKGIKPILEDYEYGRVFPIISTCQDAAISFIRDFTRDNSIVPGMEKAYFMPMYKVLKRPSDDAIKHFGDINSSDMNEIDLLLAPKVSIWNIRNLIRKFKESGWKTAFLKRNLHIPFSFEVYCLIRGLFNSRG